MGAQVQATLNFTTPSKVQPTLNFKLVWWISMGAQRWSAFQFKYLGGQYHIRTYVLVLSMES
eukprot:COSAG02_NODE_3381_length_6837_cov_83.054022_8_plen_62_part_00